jgi:hypothetical protein
VGLGGQSAQVDDPQVRQAGRDEQPAEARGIGQMTEMQMKAAAFLVREQGFHINTFANYEVGAG